MLAAHCDQLTADAPRDCLQRVRSSEGRALAAGVLDELQSHLVPVLLGQGRRLFDHLDADHIELELTGIIDAPGVTHLSYRVRR